MADPARYVFDPLDRRGIVVGLRAGQLVVLGAGMVGATAAMRSAPNGIGIALALLVVAGVAAVAFVPVGGRSFEQWAPVVARWAGRRSTGSAVTRPASRRRPARPVLPPVPPVLAAVSFRELVEPGGTRIAAISDAAARTLSAVLAVRGRSYALLDPEEKARRLAAWSSVLSGLAREDGPVRTLQWVERTVPGDAAALGRHLDAGCALDPIDVRVQSYRELIGEAGPLGQEHECLVVLSVRDRHRDAETVLRRELRLLQGQLRTADIDVAGPLDLRSVGAALRNGFDPWGRAGRERRAAQHPDLAGLAPAVSWPVSTEDGWGAMRTDDVWHATFWVAEWPRRDVGPDFLAPLILHSRAQRSVSVIMGPLPPSVGVREVEAARTAQAADDQLRQRAGFLATARRHREAEGAARREAELADGHAAYRFSGYVTVSATSPEALEDECAEIVQSAHQCRLELRRLHGIQDVALTWTLPLGRGLAAGR